MSPRLATSLLIALLTFSCNVCANQDPGTPADALIVHEWGTFTTFQDEDGVAIGGINTDDEPVPAFVHRHPAGLVQRADQAERGLNLFGKGLKGVFPDVVMRMETPIIYFYPPEHPRF